LNANSLNCATEHSFANFLASHQPGLTSRAEFLGLALLVVVLNLLWIQQGVIFWEISTVV
jgi:hypothetical protein